MPSPDRILPSDATLNHHAPVLTASPSTLYSGKKNLRVLIISLDFDGCIFNHNYFDAYKALLSKKTSPSEKAISPLEAQKQALKGANQTLIDSLARKALGLDENGQPSSKGHYAEVTFIIGSARQSWEMDFGNDIHESTIEYGTRKGKPSGSAFNGIELFKDLVNEKIIELKKGNETQGENENSTITVKCIRDDYLLSDTFSNEDHGKNFKRAKEYTQKNNYAQMQIHLAKNIVYTEEKNCPIRNISSLEERTTFDRNYEEGAANALSAARAIHDDTKATTTYAHLNKFAIKYFKKNPNTDTEIDFEFYDDRNDDKPDKQNTNIIRSHGILKALENFYESGLLVPENINLHLKEYSGAEIKHRITIKGKGEIDDDYENTVKRMVIAAGSKLYRGDYKTAANVATFNEMNERYITNALELRNAAIKLKREQEKSQEKNPSKSQNAEKIINFCDEALRTRRKKFIHDDSNLALNQAMTAIKNCLLKNGSSNTLCEPSELSIEKVNDVKNQLEDRHLPRRWRAYAGMALAGIVAAAAIGIATSVIIFSPHLIIPACILLGAAFIGTSFFHYRMAREVGKTLQEEPATVELENLAKYNDTSLQESLFCAPI